MSKQKKYHFITAIFITDIGRTMYMNQFISIELDVLLLATSLKEAIKRSLSIQQVSLIENSVLLFMILVGFKTIINKYIILRQ